MVAAAAVGCSHSSSRPVYSGPTATAAPVPVSEQRGRVVSVRDVEIRDTPATGSGSGTRGALTTAVGILTGSVTAIAGAVGDVVDASKASSAAKPAEEITVVTDGGRTVVIVQERSNPPMAPDERVIVQTTGSLSGAGKTRVIRDQFIAEPQPRTGRSRFGALEPRFSQ